MDISFAAEPLPFEEAIDFFKGKISFTKEEWEDLEPKFRFRAFTVARLAEADHIEMLRGRLLHAMEKGEHFAETWKDVKAFTEDADQPFSAGYFETVYRTNMQSAYNAGRLMQYKNNEPPAWELLFIEDGRTSDMCRGLASIAGNGKALAASHSFWSTYGFPPYHFNCRTTFRAVYDYEIGHGTTIENIPMKQIRKNFKPQEGFGGNPIEKESWWRLTDKMKERIERYGIKKEVEAAAKAAGIDNFDVRLAHNEVIKRELGHTGYHANLVKGAEPKQHEIEIAKILKENGYEVLFTPENTFIEGTKNPEGVITNLNRIVEMKKITSPRLDKISERIIETSEQNAEVAVLNLIDKKNYTEVEAISEVRKTFKEIKSNLKEVWLIWNGKLSRIKK
ncbi:phage minor head protein [Treponema sp. HNW]|uniref:phage minor head protein n=1 Tax=Treponema sp. HNW TaxID=3116654 RepID=UPI003D102230